MIELTTTEVFIQWFGIVFFGFLAMAILGYGFYRLARFVGVSMFCRWLAVIGFAALVFVLATIPSQSVQEFMSWRWSR